MFVRAMAMGMLMLGTGNWVGEVTGYRIGMHGDENGDGMDPANGRM